jgi:signal transduction histidine kinase
VILDGLIGSVSAATLVVLAVVPGLQLHLDQADVWERFAAFTYPLADVMAVVIAFMVTVRRSSHQFDFRILGLGVGMWLQAAADLSLLDGLGRTFEQAEPNFVMYLLATTCYLLTSVAVDHRPRPREYADRKPPLWPLVAPYAVLGVLLLYIGYQVIEAEIGKRSLLLLLIGMVLVGLVIARQAFALGEYRHLVEQRRNGLVGSVSHELRTPLTALVGFLDILRDPEAPVTAEEKAEMVDLAHEQAAHMSRIVADLLLLARDAPRLDIQEQEVTVAELVEGTLRTLRTAPTSISVEIGPALSGYVDPVRARQVLSNLVKNAIRYGRGKVLVVATAFGADLVVEVHDDGAGVPVRFENIIWEQFERGPNRLNSKIPGSGLGLAVVDLMVRRHGGTASYQRSRRLGGACFRVVLPGRARVTGGARALGLPVPTTVL